MTRLYLRPLLILLALIVVAGLIAPIALFHLTPPDFMVEPVAEADGTWSLRVHPNFLVNSIRSIEIKCGNAIVVSQQGVFKEVVIVELPASVPAGAKLIVECDLAYDRIMPSIESVQHQVILQ